MLLWGLVAFTKFSSIVSRILTRTSSDFLEIIFESVAYREDLEYGRFPTKMIEDRSRFSLDVSTSLHFGHCFRRQVAVLEAVLLELMVLSLVVQIGQFICLYVVI